MHKVSLSSSCSSRKRKRLSSVKKTTAVLKKAITEKSDKWKIRDWYGTTKTSWKQPAGSSGGQSSHDAWEHAKLKSKWKEVSAEFDAVGAVVKEKKNAWHKSGRESAKREADLYTMVESAATEEKQKEKDRGRLKDQLVEFRKRKDEDQGASSKRCTATLIPPRIKVFKQNKSCAVLFGSVEHFDKE